MELLPLKCTWIPKLLQIFLNLSPSPFCVGDNYGDVMVVRSFVGGAVFLVNGGCLCIEVVMFAVKFGV